MGFCKGKFWFLLGSTEAGVPACGIQEKDHIMALNFCHMLVPIKKVNCLLFSMLSVA